MTSQQRTILFMLPLQEVIRRTGLSRSSIYNRLNPASPYYDPTFPRPVRLGSTSSIRFVESELEAWLEQCVAVSRSDHAVPKHVGVRQQPGMGSHCLSGGRQ